MWDGKTVAPGNLTYTQDCFSCHSLEMPGGSNNDGASYPGLGSGRHQSLKRY